MIKEIPVHKYGFLFLFSGAGQRHRRISARCDGEWLNIRYQQITHHIPEPFAVEAVVGGHGKEGLRPFLQPPQIALLKISCRHSEVLDTQGDTESSHQIAEEKFPSGRIRLQGGQVLAGPVAVRHGGQGRTGLGMSVKQGTTLYLCLEDSVLRIQNRLFEITEDAPSSVHFCTECELIGQGLEEQVEIFLAAHPDTVLVIIDTLQMVRPARDATYANDYRDLSVLKRMADKHGIAILLIHHLRKEKADDVFHRISGTTAISGAVDSSFTLVEEKRGSGRAKLSCIGRDIEYRELTLERNGENVWELVSDSRTQPELLGDRIIYLLSELMRGRTEFIGTPTELSERIDPVGVGAHVTQESIPTDPAKP